MRTTLPPSTSTKCCSSWASSARSTSAAPTAIGRRASLKGWGTLTEHPLDRPDAAVRRRQGQERHGHAHDDRRDGPALPRPCRRLRDHVERQRLPSARPADPRGRPPGLRLRHRQDAARFQQACTRFFDVGALHLDETTARSSPPRQRASGRSITELLAVLGPAYKASKRDEEGYTPAVRARPARQGGLELRRSQLRLHAPIGPDQGGAQFRGEGGDDGRLLVKRRSRLIVARIMRGRLLSPPRRISFDAQGGT